MRRRWLVALSLPLVIAACEGSPTTGASAAIASGSPTATASPTSTPSAAPPSGLATGVTATTTESTLAPSGSIRDEMYALAYHPGDVTVPSGTFTFFLVNPADKSSATHTMAVGVHVGQPIVSSAAVALGTSAIFAVSGLPPGHYMMWCTIDGHAAEGMVGSLTVH